MKKLFTNSSSNNIIIHFFGILTCFNYLYLASHHSESYGTQSITMFITLTMAWICCLSAFFILKKIPKYFSVKSIIFWAFLFQLIASFIQPLLTTDHYRYLWDGFHFAHYSSPYTHAPTQHFSDIGISDRWLNILGLVNHPNTSTIYGPVAEYFFLLAYLISPNSIIGLKLLIIMTNCLSILLLSRITKSIAILLFAWCPLFIMETSINIHSEAFGIFFMIAGVYFFSINKKYYSAIMLAFACATKILAAPIALLLLLKMRKPHWLCFSIIMLLFYIPFLIQGHTDIVGLIAFAKHWEFNSSVFAIIKWLSNPIIAKFIVAIAFFISFIYVATHYFSEFSIHKTVPRGDIIFGFLFLLAPVINPWYYLWLLPFATIFPRPWSWLGAITVSLSYINGTYIEALHLADFAHPIWLRPLEYTPIFIAILWENYSRLMATKKLEI